MAKIVALDAAKTKINVQPAAAEPWTYQAAFWGLALLLFFPPFFRGLFFAADQERALMLAALICWCAWLWKHGRRDYAFLSHPLDYFALALPAAYILSSFVAVNAGLALDEIVKNVLYFLVYWTAVQVVTGQREAIRLLHVIYLAAVGVALAGLFTATGLASVKDGFLGGRIYSTFQYPNALASYLTAAVFLGLFFKSEYGALALRDAITDRTLLKTLPDRLLRSRPFGYLYKALDFILLAVLFGTKSRGGLLVTGAAVVLYLIGLHWQKRLPVLLHLVFLGILAYPAARLFINAATAKQMAAAWLWMLAGLVLTLAGQWAWNFRLAGWVDRFAAVKRRVNLTLGGILVVLVAGAAGFLALHLHKVDTFKYLRDAIERMYFVKDALAMIKQRPVLGWGGGGWQEAYRGFQGYLYNSNQVHSYYFQVTVETGLIGLLVVLGIWICFLWAGHRAHRAAEPGGTGEALIWTVTVAALAIGAHALIDFDLSLSALTLVLWTLFACARALAGKWTGAEGQGRL
ncbi:O-antigen ligase family protein [Desulfotomaculum copahuensis]|uniref:O-antigen ligase-related domain-containing protein n=1 Tax=Desulfotomaculum copahuensis TaxID=1838280 RepID=A0A1B7LBS0_9FIRM|nr:O-antigen ligase family protein [Desulfotomaculum copahuensis]OAT79909.1 hypothetical protein A6M21_14450 [Desulfotomaculum copahuensis]